MRTLTEREIARRYPPLVRCNCRSFPPRDPFIGIGLAPRVVGKLIEVTTTRDRFEDLSPHGYAMHPVRPTSGPNWQTRNSDMEDHYAWRIHDSGKDHHTTWCRDVFLIVEAGS